MKSLNGVAVVAAWGALAVGGFAVGQDDWQWIPIADSEADFSGVQGQGGWHYLFATSELDAGSPMQVFDSNCSPNGSAWNPAWRSQCGSYCFMAATHTHTNAGSLCSATSPGLQIAVRRYQLPSAGVHRVTVWYADAFYFPSSSHDGERVSLRINDSTIWETESTGQEYFEAVTEHVALLAANATIYVRSHPKGGCHADGHLINLWIEGLDCNGDGIVDYGQILDGTFEDANGNGVPDCCDEGVSCDPCPGDVNFDGQVNGADISVLLGFWGLNGKPVAADINKDGSVDGADLAQLLGSWGPCK